MIKLFGFQIFTPGDVKRQQQENLELSTIINDLVHSTPGFTPPTGCDLLGGLQAFQAHSQGTAQRVVDLNTILQELRKALQEQQRGQKTLMEMTLYSEQGAYMRILERLPMGLQETVLRIRDIITGSTTDLNPNRPLVLSELVESIPLDIRDIYLGGPVLVDDMEARLVDHYLDPHGEVQAINYKEEFR